MLSNQEHLRYSRHYNLPNFGPDAQQKLKAAKVLVVGAGGLGSPVLLYLAAAGVGQIGIVDFDTIDISNLQRQILYSDDQVGQKKVATAAQRVQALNPYCHTTIYDCALTTKNAIEIIGQYDVVVDGTDNFPTRYLVNDACTLTKVCNVYGSIYQFEGQVSVFNYQNEDGEYSANYRHLYPTPPKANLVPDCATGGVLGVLPGIVGSMQALEVIKVITGIGMPLVERLLHYDALTGKTRTIRYKKNNSVNITGLINYEEFCGVVKNKKNMAAIKEITVQELKTWKDEGKDFQLVDVREQNEWDHVNIEGQLIPVGDIMTRKDEIAEDKPVAFLCRSGARSAAAVNALQQLGYENLYNIKGGINAYARDVDTSLPQY